MTVKIQDTLQKSIFTPIATGAGMESGGNILEIMLGGSLICCDYIAAGLFDLSMG